ncbi:hypothetical protein [Jeongeupia naejangsanensis]|uniref:N-acetyltransferase domain-containing protein n=1 Tax=Jeongeupia naejangsanensis TaxID=613195 RepID=A0ABS2BF71_9NEIS|nr:hypothetical protein [Jeongeupia naejangsanensis]MBM3114254.1 hypothetical protein [Jeongeupia naejangsanensis]
MVVIKKPSDCSDAELQNFATLVLAGGEVVAAGLDMLIKKDEALVFLLQHNCLKGVAAIKKPGRNYRNKIFQKAMTSTIANEFQFELGWVFVHPSSRGAGFSHVLVKAALGAAGGRHTFATSRSDNAPMHKVLSAHGLLRRGQEYVSDRGNQNLVLFVSNVIRRDSLDGSPQKPRF